MNASGTERRRFPRYPAADLAAAIAGGPPAEIVNVSRGGALLQMPARFAPTSSVRVKLTRAGGEPLIVPGRVAWAKVATVSDAGQIVYHVAVEFETPLRDVGRAADIAPAEAVAEDNLEALLDEQANDRHQWSAERAEYERQVRSTAEQLEALQATLEAREKTHGDELAAQRSCFEATIGELVKAKNMQQREYHELLARFTALETEQRRRIEQYEAELTQWHALFERQHADAEARHRAMKAQIEASESLRIATESRYRALHQELGKLLATFTVSIDGHDALTIERETEAAA